MISQSLKDKLIFLLSGLLIGLGVAAFVVNVKTIQLANAESETLAPQGEVYPKDDTTALQSDLNESFFNSDPFREIREMQEQFWRSMDSRKNFFSDRSLKGFSFPQFKSLGGSSIEISESETANYHIYEISLKDADEGSSVDVNVENHQVTIHGKKIQKSTEGHQQTGGSFFSSSSFSQSFTVPRHLDSDNVIVQNQGNKVILKFPRLGSEV